MNAIQGDLAKCRVAQQLAQNLPERSWKEKNDLFNSEKAGKQESFKKTVEF